MSPIRLSSCRVDSSARHEATSSFCRDGRPGAHDWYAADDAWRLPLEREARRRYGATLRRDWGDRALIYRLDGLLVPGREPIDVRIAFFADPYYDTYGLPARDYPRVFADPGVESPHRMPGDGALCLYFPRSSPERRWRSQDGLLMLLDLTRDHLFFESHWRDTGAHAKGEWLGGEAPHGFPRGRTA